MQEKKKKKENINPSYNEKDRGKGYLGISFAYLNVGACIITPEEALKNSVDRPTMCARGNDRL